MEIRQAIEAISSGHVIYSVETAEEVCACFQVTCPKSLVQVYESDRTPKDVRMYHGPEEGVYSLDLAEHVAECLGVKDRAGSFIGRGSQAREYARVVAEKLDMTKLPATGVG